MIAGSSLDGGMRFDQNSVTLNLRMMSNDEAAAPKTTLALVTQLVTMFAIYLFFAGWSYSSHFRGNFGLSDVSFDIPSYLYIAYAFQVFFKSPVGWLLMGGLAVCWYVAARVRFIFAVELVVVVFLAMAPFALIDLAAKSAAYTQYADLRSGRASAVKVTVKDPARALAYEDVIKASGADRLFLLTQTKDRAYVFTKNPAELTSKILPEANVFTLDLADVVLVVTLESVEENR